MGPNPHGTGVAALVRILHARSRVMLDGYVNETRSGKESFRAETI